MQPFIPDELPIQSINYADGGLVRLMGEANRALSRYDALVQHSRSPQLILAPLVSREAMLSSRIEGSQSTLTEVLQFEESETSALKGEQRDDLNEIKNYISALRLGEQTLKERPFSLNILRELHGKLLGTGSVRGKTKNPGNFRTRQNWIGFPGMSVEQASFVPPEPVLVQEFMEKWESFYHSDQPDALIQAAVIHAQFELIHPFEDGNGRLGRLLIPLFLHEKEIISRPNFYPSAYLERNRDMYIDALKQLGGERDKWNNWVMFFLKAVVSQATEDSAKVKRLMDIYEDLKSRVVDITRSKFAVPVLDVIFERPVFGITMIAKKLSGMERPPTTTTIGQILKNLEGEGVVGIVSQGKGRRRTIYQLNELMDLLEEG